MSARRRATRRARTTVGARRRRRARAAPRGRAVGRELRAVLHSQVESGDELRKTKVPIATEPAFGFKP